MMAMPFFVVLGDSNKTIHQIEKGVEYPYKKK